MIGEGLVGEKDHSSLKIFNLSISFMVFRSEVLDEDLKEGGNE